MPIHRRQTLCPHSSPSQPWQLVTLRVESRSDSSGAGCGLRLSCKQTPMRLERLLDSISLANFPFGSPENPFRAESVVSLNQILGDGENWSGLGFLSLLYPELSQHCNSGHAWWEQDVNIYPIECSGMDDIFLEGLLGYMMVPAHHPTSPTIAGYERYHIFGFCKIRNPFFYMSFFWLWLRGQPQVSDDIYSPCFSA